MRARATGGKLFSGYHQKIGKGELLKLLRLRTVKSLRNTKKVIKKRLKSRFRSKWQVYFHFFKCVLTAKEVIS